MRTKALPLVLLAVLPAPAGIDCADDARECLSELIRPYAVEAARASVPAPDRFEVIAYRFGGADPVAAGRHGVELLESSRPGASGVVRLRFRLLLDGRAAGEARATVRGRVVGEALVATRVLASGAPIERGAVERRALDLTRLRETPLRSWKEIGGRVPARTLGVGRPLTPSLLEPRALVRQGDAVELLLTRRRLSIKATGRALQDGAAGATVLAEIVPRGGRVLARVEPDGTLQVLGPGGSR